MSRVRPFLIAAALLAAAAATASAQTLTRIETKPFYGAVITIEEGVRVFRPLPTTGHMIINPEGRAPVSVSINEYRDGSGVNPAMAPMAGGYPEPNTDTRGLYLNPWAGFGIYGPRGHRGHFGHHGRAARYLTPAGGRPHHAPGGPGKGGGHGKGGSGHR